MPKQTNVYHIAVQRQPRVPQEAVPLNNEASCVQ